MHEWEYKDQEVLDVKKSYKLNISWKGTLYTHNFVKMPIMCSIHVKTAGYVSNGSRQLYQYDGSKGCECTRKPIVMMKV